MQDIGPVSLSPSAKPIQLDRRLVGFTKDPGARFSDDTVTKSASIAGVRVLKRMGQVGLKSGVRASFGSPILSSLAQLSLQARRRQYGDFQER